MRWRYVSRVGLYQLMDDRDGKAGLLALWTVRPTGDNSRTITGCWAAKAARPVSGSSGGRAEPAVESAVPLQRY